MYSWKFASYFLMCSPCLFLQLPPMSTSDFNASSRLQELLTESENLTRELNACQRSQANGSTT